MDASFRLLIVDDQPRTRQSLRALLEACLPVVDVAMAANGFEAIDCIHAAPPDLVIMDAHMPGLDGIETTRWIKTHYPDLRVILLSMYASYQSAALQAGADAFLTKQAPVDLLRVTEATMEAHRGGFEVK